MNNRILPLFSALLLVVLAGILLASCGTSNAPATVTPSANRSAGNVADGQALMQQRCVACHSLSRITAAHKTADQWKTTVGRMVTHGAQLTTQEKQTLIDYLAQNYK